MHSAEQHRAKNDIVSSRHAPKHLCPRQVEHAGGAHSELACTFAYPCGKRCTNLPPSFHDGESVAVYINKPKRRRGFIDIAEHFLEERYVLLSRSTKLCLCNEVSKW